MKFPATLLVLLAAAPATANAQPAQEIGTWRLSCTVDRMTDRGACTLRHRDWVERPASGAPGLGVPSFGAPGPGIPGPSIPGLALEVLDRGGRQVPAVTARDLTLEGASRGLLALSGTAQLRFPPNRLFDLPCTLEGRSVVCAPRAEDAVRAAAELALADRVLVRMQGMAGGTADPTELRLAGTEEALSRLRREAPAGTAPAEPPGLDGRDVLQRLLRLLGV